MNQLKRKKLYAILTGILLVIAIIGGPMLYANETKYISGKNELAMVSEHQTPSFDIGINSPNTWTGRDGLQEYVTSDTVALIGTYSHELYSTVTFGTVDAYGKLVYVFGGGHSGYEKVFKDISLPYTLTEYGYIIDVTSLQISADQFEMVSVANVSENADVSVYNNEQEYTCAVTGKGSTSFSNVIKEDGKIVGAGFSGSPILQDGKLVGFITGGAKEGARYFTATYISTFVEVE